MSYHKELPNPGYEIVFECTFDDLMQQVAREHLMDVHPWEVVGERLLNMKVSYLDYVDWGMSVQ